MFNKIRLYIFSLFVIFCSVVFFYFTGCCSKGSGGSGFVAGNVGGHQPEPKLFDVKVNEDGSITKTLAPSGRLSIEAPKNTLNKDVVVHMVENQAIGNESDIYSVGKYIYAIKPDREDTEDTGIKVSSIAKRDVKMQTNPIILTFSDDERLTGAENYYIGIKEIGGKDWQFVNVYSATNLQINSNGPKGSFEYKLYKDNVLVALFADFNKNLEDRPKVLSMVASMPSNVIEILDGRYNEDAVIKLKFIGDNLSSLRADDYRIRLHYANTDSKQVNIRIDGKTANYTSGTSTNKYEAFGELYAHYYEFIPTTASYSAGVTPELSFTVNFKKFPVGDFSSNFVVEVSNATDKAVPFYLSDSLCFDTKDAKEQEPEPSVATMTVMFSLASDSTDIFDTAKNLYYLNPTFTVTASPSYEFTDEAKSIIASSVTLVEMNSVVRANTASSTETTEQTFEADDELLTTEWNEKGLIIGFKQRLATYTQYVISMNDMNVLEGVNIEPFGPFTFRTAGALEVKIASDSNNLIDLENNLYHCRPLFTINPGFNPNDSEKAAIASAVSVIGAEDGIVTKTWNNSILSISFSRNLAADTEYTVSMSEPAGMKRLCLKPFQPLKFKTTGEFYIALVPDVDNVFDTENSLYRCRPSFTITPSVDLKDEDQAKIASAVRVVGVEESSIQKTWASGSLTISFTQDIGQNGEFTLSISDLPEIEGRNFITFQPFVFKTIGALAIALSADNDNVYVPANQLYNCSPGFTITPSIPLNEEDRAKIAEAVSVSNVGANQITKNWDNDGKLIIGFSQNLAPATEYRLSMSDVTSINGVTVNGFEPLVFNTVGNLEFTLTPNANNVYTAVESKYRCNPGFTITPSFVLNEEDRAKIANAVTINNNASLIKNWEGNNLKVSLNQNLATNTAYMLSMSAINDIKGINVVPFAALNFTTLGALSFTVTPDDDNVYATVSPKYQCRPGFTVTPSFTLTDEDRAKIADAVIISNVGNIASKTWEANNLRISMTDNLAADTAYSLSMAAVDNIDGIAVTPFAAVDFTTIGTLNFTVTPDDDNLFDIPNSLTHCKPGFTLVPSFALTDADKTKIINAVAVSDVASASITKEWNNEGNIYISFNTKLASGTDYSLNMADVDDIKGVIVSAFDPQPFRTMNAINITLDSEDSNIIDVPNNLYHCRPQFTITAGFDADDDAKAIIASAVSVIGADENNITKTWINDNLVVGFTSNLTTNTEYTISIGDLNASFEKLAFRLPESLTFTTTGDSYVAIVPDEENVIVSTPNELYHCRPTFTITPSVALGDSDRATIAGAIHVSNVLDGNLTKNWDASGSLILGFTQNLAHNTEYTVSIDSVGEIAGVNLVLFQPFTFTTVPALNLVLTADTGNVYEAVPSLYRCNPAFTITPSFALSDTNKAIIADAVSVSNSAVTVKNWEGNNLRITFSSDLAPDSFHTVSMAAVSSITGVSVNAFAEQSFTTLPALTFTLNSPDSNVFISTPSERYHCRPVFTLTPGFNLNDADRTIIANAVTINNSANLMTKNWNGNVLEISFSSDLPNSTDFTLSMNAVTSISGVSVTPFTAKNFTTIEGLVISIASDSGDLFTIENAVGLYHTLPTFTVTSNIALSATDQTKIANAINVSNIASPKVTKSWANSTTLNISFTENLSLNTNYSITMDSVNNISGVSVTGFSPLNFRTMNALTFNVAADSGNVYEALDPLYRCNPSFTITPNYTLSETVKTTIANAVSVTNSSVTSKNWNGNNLRVTFTSALTPDSTYTLNMAAVNSITGVTVTPFDSLDFTTVPILTLTLDSPDSNIYISTPSELYHCRPVFTVTPSFNLNDDDKSLIANAVVISSGTSLLTKTWNNNVLEIGFSSDLNNGGNFTLSMNNVSISGVSVVKFSSKTFKTLNSLSVSIASDNGNVFVTQNGVKLYHTLPTFTVTSNSNLNSTLKNRVAEAISVSDVDSSIISKVWTNDRTLKISFTDNIAVNASYTISMAAINDITGVSVSSFNDFDFSTMDALRITLTSDAANIFVSTPTELYNCRPSFTINVNYTLSSTNKNIIANAINVSNASGVNKSWNNNSLRITLSSDLSLNSAHTVSMSAVNDIYGVIVSPFEPLNFTTMEALTFTLTPDADNVYEAMSPKYVHKPVFTITPNYILNDANKSKILSAVSVTSSSYVSFSRTWDGNNLKVTFPSYLSARDYTLKMSDVTSITGVTVIPFDSFDFSVLNNLLFTVTPDADSVYEALDPKIRCRPAFTITPSFTLNDEDKSKIADAILISNTTENNIVKSWNGNDLRVSFNENLSPNKSYEFSMASVSGMDKIYKYFNKQRFTTIATLTFTITANSDNYFSGYTHCIPGYTITPSFTLNDEDKPYIANAVSISGVNNSIIDKHWDENKLILGLTQNLATSTNYTISMDEITGLTGVIVTRMSSYNFNTVPDLIVSIATNSNSIVKRTSSLELEVNGKKYFYCQPEFVVSTNFSINSTVREKIENSLFIEGVDVDILPKNSWYNNRGTYVLSDILAASTTYNFALSDITEYKGVTIKLSPYSFTTFFHQGRGTVSDPFTIYTPAQLACLDYYPNQNYYYKQMEDLDLSCYDNWKPIGSSSTFLKFAGIYDGNNKIISNAVINYPESDYIGLFAAIDRASFSNINLNNFNVSGYKYVGCLGGYTNGGSSSIYTNIICDSANVTGYTRIGGVFGCFEGNLQNCIISNSTIIGQSYSVGGFIGHDNPLFTASGIRCENLFVKSNGNYVGGFVGEFSLGKSMNDINCVNVNVEGAYGVGGAIGYLEDAQLSNCNVSDSIASGAGEVGGAIGYGRESVISEVRCKNLNIKSKNDMAGGIGGMIVIDNELTDISCNNVNVEGKGYVGGAFGWLTESTLNGATVSNSIASGSSKFVGGCIGCANYTTATGVRCENLWIKSLDSYAGGFVGCCNGVGDFSNITCDNVNVEGIDSVGGLSGHLYNSKLNSCYIANSVATGTENRIGGCIGNIEKTNIRAILCENLQVKSTSYVGGFVGEVKADCELIDIKCDNVTVEGNDCIGGFAGSIASSSADSCCITGCSIVADDDVPSVAGLVGSNTGDISNCYMYNSTLTGKADYGALIGANGSGARTPVISDCFVSQDHDILINTNYKDAPENCYYNVNDLSTFNGETWSDGAWSNYDTSVFPPKLSDLPEP